MNLANLHAECTRVTRRDSRRLLATTVSEHIGILPAQDVLSLLQEDADRRRATAWHAAVECLCQPLLGLFWRSQDDSSSAARVV